MADGRSARRVQVPEATEPVIDLVDTVELQMLRVAVHRPELVPTLVTEELFADPRHREIFAALLASGTLHEAIDNTRDGAQVLLQGLIVQDVDDMDQIRAERLAGRLVDEATSRELRRLEGLARSTGDPAIGQRVATLHQARDRLRTDNWGLPAAEALVAWLVPAEQL